jgi:hypothetical protein
VILFHTAFTHIFIFSHLISVAGNAARSYCGSEMGESEIYSPYSFCGSEAGHDVAQGDPNDGSNHQVSSLNNLFSLSIGFKYYFS